jgi:hypothetical protein
MPASGMPAVNSPAASALPPPETRETLFGYSEVEASAVT